MADDEKTDNSDAIEHDEVANNEGTIINDIISDLFSGIDSPGDKERVAPEGDYKGEQVTEETKELDEATFYDPASLVEYDRPELKTDKRRRVTTDDFNKLLSDYDRTIAGGKPDAKEPVFGKDIEPEIKVSELPELQDQKIFDDKGKYHTPENITPKSDKPIEPPSITDKDSGSPLDMPISEEEPLTQIDTEAKTIDSMATEGELPPYTEKEEELSDNIIDDFDEKFTETPIGIPQKGFSDIISEKDEQKTIPDFADMDGFIKEVDSKGSAEDIESEFGNLVPVSDVKEDDKQDTTTLDELEGIINPVETEFDAIPEIQEPTIEEPEIEEVKEEEGISTLEAEEEPTLVDEIAEEPIKDTIEIDESLESTNFDLKDDLNIPHDRIEELTATPIPKPIEEPQDSKVIPTQTKPTTYDILNFTTQEIETIQNNLHSLPSYLSNIATDVIVNEKLDPLILKQLINILLEPKVDVNKVKTFIESNVDIDLKKHKYPSRIHDEVKPSKLKTAAFIAIAALVLFAIGLTLYYLIIDIEPASTKDYEIGLNYIHTTDPKYLYAEQKFDQARKASAKDDIKWYNKYAKEYIIRGDEEAINLAEKKLIEAEKIDPTNKDTRNLFAKLYIQKAHILAYNNKNGLTKSFGLAFSKGFNHIQENENTLDQKAKAYISFGDLLIQNNKDKDAKEQYEKANSIYEKILSSDKSNTLGLYGLLRLSLRPDKSNTNIIYSKSDDIYNSFQDSNPDNPDELALTEYATNLIDRKKSDKALDVLEKVIKYKPYTEAYYQIARVYKQKPININKSLENYQKALLAYYVNYFFNGNYTNFEKHINKGETNKEQIERFKDSITKTITLIKNDKNPINNIVQGKIFNDIGENYLYQSNEYQPSEQEYKKDLISVAKKNFYLSISKENKNYKPFKNLGNLAYSESVDNPNIPTDAKTVEEGLRKVYEKPKKYYLYAINLLINNGEPSNDTINDLLIKEAGNSKISPNLYYKIGYIYYKEKQYKQASNVWQSAKSSDKKFSPTLNFSLANSYLREKEYDLAQVYYQNVIDRFKNLANKYNSNPDPADPKQNKVYARLASAHNNIGVSYHMRAEKYNNSKFRDDALFHYQMAHQYYSKLNHKLYLSAKDWNTKLLNNKLWVNNIDITLKQRNASIDRMILDSVEPYLNSNNFM